MVTVIETESGGSGGFVPPNFPVAGGNGDGDKPDKKADFIVIFTDRRRTQRHMLRK